MAAPHVAAAAGLLLSRRPELRGEDVGAILRQTARPLGGAVPNPEFGYGRLDLAAALQASGCAGTPRPAGSPAATVTPTPTATARATATARTTVPPTPEGSAPGAEGTATSTPVVTATATATATASPLNGIGTPTPPALRGDVRLWVPLSVA
jgi:subtilisin family serine protease